jgi:hypothetical protein
VSRLALHRRRRHPQRPRDASPRSLRPVSRPLGRSTSRSRARR